MSLTTPESCFSHDDDASLSSLAHAAELMAIADSLSEVQSSAVTSFQNALFPRILSLAPMLAVPAGSNVQTPTLPQRCNRTDGNAKPRVLGELQNIEGQLTTLKRKRQGSIANSGDMSETSNMEEPGNGKGGDGEVNTKRRKTRDHCSCRFSVRSRKCDPSFNGELLSCLWVS